jgi:hypothetical protein
MTIYGPASPSPVDLGTHMAETAHGLSSSAAGHRTWLPAGGDLGFMNRDPGDEFRQWVALLPGEWDRIEARVRGSIQVRDEFITIPFPRLASTSDQQLAQAAESYKREAAIVDPRLSREVTCAFKAIALSDLCTQLRSDTGIQLTAGPSVADEKVTLFCEAMPLREVMRQLSRPFGYTWLRSRQGLGLGSWELGKDKPGRSPTPNSQVLTPVYRYELVQDLRSQLLEEELRNRDRNAALLDLDREMSRYRPYLSLSPDEALARAALAPTEEKKLLEYLAGKGWGPAQLYARLTPADLAALRAGQKLSFNAAAGSGARPLPPEMARNVITSLRDYRIVRRGEQFDAAPAKYLPDGLPPTAVPEAQPMVSLSLDRSELGQLTLHGLSGFFIGTPPDCLQLMGDGEQDLAVGMSPAVRSPENALANARFAHDPALAKHVTISNDGLPATSKAPAGRTSLSDQSKIQNPKSKITSADVLEVLHRATGLPIVADYYTRLYPASELAVQNTRLFDALNRLADTMRLRWSKDADHGAGGWLQFRSADFYDARLKEVPNRLLFRWAASRREHGTLTLDDLIEISQLTDAQLDSSTMAEGARVLYGLEEWDLTRRSELRPHWRFLAGLSPEQRQTAQRATGLPISRMSLAQQQQFLTLLPSQFTQLQSLEELSEASLQIDHTVPGEFQWTPPAPESAPALGIPPAPRVRAPTRQAALQAAQQIDPQVTDAQITPTEAGLTLTYRLGGPKARFTPMVIRANLHNLLAQLPRPVGP